MSIDIVDSISRVMPNRVEDRNLQAAGIFREYLAIHREAEALINIGAYTRGRNTKNEIASEKIDLFNQLRTQGLKERVCF